MLESDSLNKVKTKIDYSSQFNDVLIELAKLYKKFPKFMIEIFAENNGIPHSELDILIWKFKKNGVLILIKNEGYYFTLKNQ